MLPASPRRLLALGDAPQTVEVHVRAARDCYQCVPLEFLALRIDLHARNRQRTGGFEDRTGVLKHVLDSCTDRIRVDANDVVDVLADQLERVLTDLAHRRTVGKQSDVMQLQPATGGQRTRHRIRVGRLHANHLDLRCERLDVRRHAGDQAAAPNGHEHCVNWPVLDRMMLPQDFHRDRATGAVLHLIGLAASQRTPPYPQNVALCAVNGTGPDQAFRLGPEAQERNHLVQKYLLKNFGNFSLLYKCVVEYFQGWNRQS